MQLEDNAIDEAIEMLTVDSEPPQARADLPGRVTAFDVFSLFLLAFGFGLAATFGIVLLIRMYL